METTLDMSPEVAGTTKRSLRERQAATLIALDSFMEQDESEHQDTLRVLRQALTEDRSGQRLVFGEAGELK